MDLRGRLSRPRTPKSVRGPALGAQRVGYLSAEKRKNGDSREFDDEIRMLGERYGIPTEFTSYLVTEPQFAVMRTAGGVGRLSPSVAPMALQQVDASASKTKAFESAKAASAQRSMNSVAAMDSMSAVLAGPRADGSLSMRRVDTRTFTLRDGVWTDERYRPAMNGTRIKPFSKAYFDLISALPELRAVFALGNRVVVAGRDRAIILADDGVDTLSSTALAALTKAW